MRLWGRQRLLHGSGRRVCHRGEREGRWEKEQGE